MRILVACSIVTRAAEPQRKRTCLGLVGQLDCTLLARSSSICISPESIYKTVQRIKQPRYPCHLAAIYCIAADAHKSLRNFRDTDSQTSTKPIEVSITAPVALHCCHTGFTVCFLRLSQVWILHDALTCTQWQQWHRGWCKK